MILQEPVPLELNFEDDHAITDTSVESTKWIQLWNFLKQTKTHQSRYLTNILDYRLALCYYCCFVSVGMCLAALGPALLALAQQTNRYRYNISFS